MVSVDIREHSLLVLQQTTWRHLAHLIRESISAEDDLHKHILDEFARNES